MRAGLDAVFVAVPRTNDIDLGVVIGLRTYRAIFGDRLEHPLHDAALADRSGAMRATIMPGVEFAIEPEDSDFEVAADDDLAVAVDIIRDFSGVVFGHASSPVLAVRNQK